MSFLTRDQAPSIKGEMDKLEETDKKRKSEEEARQIEKFERSPMGMARKRIENAAKHVKVTEYTPEALTEARAKLVEANTGLDEMMNNKTGHHGTDLSNSEYWHKEINIAKETIRQLEALRDENVDKAE